jgi:hypothetical protein
MRPVREWIPPTRSKGISTRRGRRISRMARMSSSYGFPLITVKASVASLSRSVIASPVSFSQKLDGSWFE